MPDTPSESPPASQPSRLNDQIQDALNQLRAVVSGTDNAVFQATAYQALVQAVSLAMHNAVAEQQQNQILRMALTSAAAKSILEGRKEEAENILELAKSRLATPDISSLVAEARLLIETISNDLARARSESGAEPAEKPPRPAAAAKKQAARKPPSKSPASAAS
jgi:hypothetical protein